MATFRAYFSRLTAGPPTFAYLRVEFAELTLGVGNTATFRTHYAQLSLAIIPATIGYRSGGGWITKPIKSRASGTWH